MPKPKVSKAPSVTSGKQSSSGKPQSPPPVINLEKPCKKKLAPPKIIFC